MLELPQIGSWLSLIGAIVLAVSYTTVTARAIINREDTAGYTVFGNVLFVIPIAFAIIYLGLFKMDPTCFIGRHDGSFLDSLYFSYVTWTTLGYGDITPQGSCRVFATSQAVMGYIFLALVSAYFIDRFRQHQS